ncbi:MAG: phosphate/phosphite/phosphonate ABC transporter substrate-binding protein [Oligoflexia bacterium]|nr:phosphate/phosphite/phosphonate ABC transporter substrate-binding protein [Oligoflexia bacterium]
MQKSLLLLICVALGLTACTKKSDEVIYTMGFTPAENAETVNTNGKVIADIIFKKTGIKIKTYVASDYTALIESMKGGTVQFGWLASFGFVLAEKHAGAKVLLKSVRHGKPYFYSAIITRSDKPFRKIEDLKGKNIAWVDPASASGYIVPKASLLNDGIDADKFFKKQVFAGGHDSVVLGVIMGSVDAGATFTNEPEGLTGSWTMLTNAKPEYKEKIRTVYVSQPIPNDTFATTDNFNKAHPEVVAKVMEAVKSLETTEEGKKALKDLYRIDSLIEAKSEDFEPLRKAADVIKIDIGGKKK